MLVKNHYVKHEEKKDSEIDIQSEITNVEQPKPREKNRAVEYKWAFGQKIPVDYEWKVK